jgi:hypothetical protein
VPIRRTADGKHRQSGQSTAEFALVMPILVLLFFGLAFAGWYAFRATAADWGVFISGVARGAYSTPGSVSSSVLWSDLRSSIHVGANDTDRQAYARVAVQKERNWLYGILLQEVRQAETNFRLWRFYPGPLHREAMSETEPCSS